MDAFRETFLNFVRRLILIVVGLLLVGLITMLFLFPQQVSSMAQAIEATSPALRVLLVIAVDVVILGLVFVQVRPVPRANVPGLMVNAAGAVTDVSIESARERILKAVHEVPNVVAVTADVQAINGKADIELKVRIDGDDIKVPDKQREIHRALQRVINKQLGLQMAGRPRVHIRLLDEPEVTPSPPSADVSASAPLLMPSPIKEPEPEEAPARSGLFAGLLGGAREETPETPVADADQATEPATPADSLATAEMDEQEPEETSDAELATASAPETVKTETGGDEDGEPRPEKSEEDNAGSL